MANARIRNCSWKNDVILKDALSIYVQQNLSRSEMLDFITHKFPQYAWSERTLDRRRKHFGIYYIDKNVTVKQVQNAVKEELKGPGELLGYRAMHQKLRQEHRLCVPRAVVHAAMYEADPDALERRKPCLKKKKEKGNFVSKGPNWVHSLDGHDKLMGYQNRTFPIAVYGSIDTCSRKIMWLKVWSSNSDPKIIGRFYLEHLFHSKSISNYMRIDKGTETGHMAAVHCLLHQNSMEEPSDSIIYGPSTSNQIERWWKDLHERLEKHYKKHLVSLKDTGQYDPENQLHRNLLAFVMVPLIQREANIFVGMWNSHRIRAQKNTLLPDGVPNHIHAFPERYGLEECGRPISTEELEAAAVASAVFDDNQNQNYIPTEIEERCIELIRQSNQDLSNVCEKFMYLKYAY